ncbi:phenylacetate-CoA oxygenase/reductase subunit PaaK [Terrimonas sp. NA20]|uniref:Phenylacetate-CoA oxygenase/reductase subunit PaaK n=1 Tax=Terrimonas ginsenosidimutans TaxID=2908004 RepID=A0ABS9KUW3_9BACT|nr:1,2-phenylacetyl-CoA epoxidase subunit PaaE [Terrimonas ginsenosidimutans]MCG2616132.1 phenylacetate-CoA oxygenase/reductase subunit PaaK [Terrimonas ginsenosidimutans]
MSIHFHKLRIKDIRKETDDCISISFAIPEELKDTFVFQHGQNITLKHDLQGGETRRSYSICTSPFDNELRVAVKKVEGGLFSGFAHSTLKAGDVVDVLPPTGKFNTGLHPGQAKKYLAFAAGSGITPVISIIKTVLQTEPASTFTLVYGNRSRHSIIFFEELEALKNKYLQRLNIIHILSREGTDTSIHAGRIDGNKLNELSRLINYPSMDEIFICGPEEMIFTIKDFMEAQQIDSKKVHFELFTTPGQKKNTNPMFFSKKKASDKSHITIKLDGRTLEFELAPDSEDSILDTALKLGADLPYSCRGGVCCTCKAKLTEGKVEMEMNWGLEEEEVKQGYILTCMSHPRSAKVVVDFDVK